MVVPAVPASSRGSVNPPSCCCSPSPPRYREFEKLFPANPGPRAIVHIRVERVSDSCGFSVPLYEFQAERDTLTRWAAARTAEQLGAYRLAKNRYSIDGLAAIPTTLKPRPLREIRERPQLGGSTWD
jgi:hypothetical protein